MFSGEINDRKERKKVKMFSQQKLVPKIAVVRKEEGATAAASHLPSPTQRNSAGSLDCRFAGRTGSVLHRRIQISGKLPLNTANVLPSTRIETPAIFRIQLLDSPIR